MPDPVYGFGAKEVSRIAAAVRDYERAPDDRRGQPSPRQDDGEADGFWAKITGAADHGGNSNRKRYAWTEQRPTVDGWDDMPSGRSGTTSTDYALNSTEANNPTTAGMMGNSVDTAATSTTFAPVRGNPVVWMRYVWAWDSSASTWVRTIRFTYEGTVDCGS